MLSRNKSAFLPQIQSNRYRFIWEYCRFVDSVAPTLRASNFVQS